MKEPYGKGLASHLGPESYADYGNIVGVAWTRGTRRPAMELRNHSFRVPTLYCHGEGNMGSCATGERLHDAAESKTLCMCENSKRENREICAGGRRQRRSLPRSRDCPRFPSRLKKSVMLM